MCQEVCSFSCCLCAKTLSFNSQFKATKTRTETLQVTQSQIKPTENLNQKHSDQAIGQKPKPYIMQTKEIVANKSPIRELFFMFI